MIEQLVDKMILHMNEKYDDTFTFVRVVGQRFGADIYRIIVASEKYPDDNIIVTAQKPENELVITDNYVGVIYQNQTRNEISKLLKDEFGDDVLVKYKAYGYPSTPDFDENTPFEKYVSDARSGIKFNAIVVVDSPTVDVQNFEDRLRKTFGSDKICSSGCVYFTDKEEDLNKISDERGFGLYQMQHSYITRCTMVMKNSHEFNMVEWEKA